MSPEITLLFLKKHLAQYNLGKDQAEKIIRIGKSRLIQKGDKVIVGGSDCPLYLLLSGKMKLIDCGAADDDWIFMDILRAGEFFGDVTLSGKKTGDRFAQAITGNTLVCYFFTGDVKQMIRENPDIALVFAVSVGKKLTQMEKRNLWFMRKDTKTRVIEFFRKWAEMEGIRTGDKLILNNDLTLTDIAEYICTSRQTIHTILSEFRKAGLLEWHRKKIAINPSLWQKSV